MTTKTHDTDSLQSSSIKVAPFSGLRLVANRGDEAHEPAELPEVQALPCVVLKSALRCDKNVAAPSVLTNLFKSLRLGERIEFVHRIHRPASLSATVAHPYSLSVKVACTPARAGDLKNKIAETLLTAYPRFHFVACDELPVSSAEGPAQGDALPHVVQFAPSGVVVTTKPADSRFEQNALGKFMAGDSDATSFVWPFPKDLPSWGLTAPLYEPMELPDTIEINIRIHAFSLSVDMCEELHKTLFRVLSNNLAVFHPDSPITSYSSSADLASSAADLVRSWLRHPSGFAVDLVIRSSARLGEVARRRLAADVFGERPVEVVRSFVISMPQTLALPTLAWACTPDQGVPALVPGIAQLPSLGIPLHYPVPSVALPHSGAFLGTTVCGRRSSAVVLPPESRSRHVALFGSTGSGKSSLLSQMIAEDISDPLRRCGVGLIDPHGDLYQRVLSMIPPERADDVVLVDTSDIFNTACLNPLEGMQDNPLHAQFIVGEIMSLIDVLFEEKNTSGPVLRANLRQLLLLSACRPGVHGTFLDAARILEDSDYCDYMLSKCKDRSVVDNWNNFKKTRGSESGFEAWVPYIMARLSPFTSNPIMKRLINRPDSTIDLAQAMADKKIVLFNLNKGVLQDIECRILGSLIMMKFFSAALGRARVPAEQRAPFHLYVDEFQTFATDSVSRIFSEARKYGLCLTTANQSLGQLGRSNIADSILANTSTKYLFRLGPSDMDTLKPYFSPQFDAETMATLPDFHAVACMSDKNKPLPPFVLRANLAASNSDMHVPAADLVSLSRRRYTVPIKQANKELMRLYELSEASLGDAGPAMESEESMGDVGPVMESDKPNQVRLHHDLRSMVTQV